MVNLPLIGINFKALTAYGHNSDAFLVIFNKLSFAKKGYLVNNEASYAGFVSLNEQS